MQLHWRFLPLFSCKNGDNSDVVKLLIESIVKKFLLALVCLFGMIHAPHSGAETLIHNSGFTKNNASLPAQPYNTYGSNVIENGVNWDAYAGSWGITGTPDIALSWYGGGRGGQTGTGLDTYANWNGKGAVVQFDASQGGTKDFSVTFVPGAATGVRILSFVLDGWSTAYGPFEVEWSITDEEGNSLLSGIWSRSTGGRDTITPAFSGAIGQTLILKIDYTTGSGDALALDELKFDQIAEGVTPIASIVLDKQSYLQGQDISAIFVHGPGNIGDYIAVFSADSIPGQEPALLQKNVDSSQGTAVFVSAALPEGNYAAWFLGEDDTVLAGPAAFTVIPNPSLTLDKTHYEPGETITASFAHGPGNASDWIGIYPQGIVPSGDPASKLWAYMNGTHTSGGDLKEGTVAFVNQSLVSGHYNAWYLSSGGYNQLTEPVAFTIGGSGAPVWLVDVIRSRHVVIGEPCIDFVSNYISQANGPYVFEKPVARLGFLFPKKGHCPGLQIWAISV